MDDSKSTCIPITTENINGTIVNFCYEDSPAPLPDETPLSSFEDTLRKLLGEMLGTAMLVSVVVSSGISAQRLAPNDPGVQLLINAACTSCGLFVLITIFGPVSGAHFNPVVSLTDYFNRDMSLTDAASYIAMQFIGGILGTIFSNMQFKIPTVLSTTDRYSYNLWISELIASATLLLVIHGCIRTGQKETVPAAVALWVGGGWFFTSSSIFANPAVTFARAFTSSATGIDLRSTGMFILFQLLGTILGFVLIRFFFPSVQPVHKDD